MERAKTFNPELRSQRLERRGRRLVQLLKERYLLPGVYTQVGLMAIGEAVEQEAHEERSRRESTEPDHEHEHDRMSDEGCPHEPPHRRDPVLGGDQWTKEEIAQMKQRQLGASRMIGTVMEELRKAGFNKYRPAPERVEARAAAMGAVYDGSDDMARQRREEQQKAYWEKLERDAVKETADKLVEAINAASADPPVRVLDKEDPNHNERPSRAAFEKAMGWSK